MGKYAYLAFQSLVVALSSCHSGDPRKVCLIWTTTLRVIHARLALVKARQKA
jgi:hypothetical protein